MEFQFTIEPIAHFSERDQSDFAALLKQQGQVANPSKATLRSCPFLCIVRDASIPIAIGAIKQVYDKPFDYAQVGHLKGKYLFEIGYFFVVDDVKYRRKGIARKICELLLTAIGSDKIFATTEVKESNGMRHLLESLGFERIGHTYRGKKTNKEVGLFVLPPFVA